MGQLVNRLAWDCALGPVSRSTASSDYPFKLESGRRLVRKTTVGQSSRSCTRIPDSSHGRFRKRPRSATTPLFLRLLRKAESPQFLFQRSAPTLGSSLRRIRGTVETGGAEVFHGVLKTHWVSRTQLPWPEFFPFHLLLKTARGKIHLPCCAFQCSPGMNSDNHFYQVMPVTPVTKVSSELLPHMTASAILPNFRT